MEPPFKTKKTVKLTVLVYLFFALLYVLTSQGHITGDEGDVFVTAMQVVERGVWHMPSPEEQIQLTNEQYIISNGRESPSGRHYTVFGFAWQIVSVAFYACGSLFFKVLLLFAPQLVDYRLTFLNFFVSLQSPLLTALLIAFFFWFAVIKMKATSKNAWLTTLLIGLGTSLWNSAKGGQAEIYSAFFLFAAFALIYPPAHQGKTSRHIEGKYLRLSLSASLVILSFFTKNYNLILAPSFIFLTWIANRSRDRLNACLLYSFILCLGMGLFFLANYVQFDEGFLDLRYASRDETVKTWFTPALWLKSCYVYVLSFNKSFFFYNPPLILSAYFLFKVQGKTRDLALFVGILSLNLLLPLLFWSSYGMSAWGPRLLLPLVPFWGLLLLLNIHRVKKPLVSFVLIFSIVFQFVGVITNSNRVLNWMRHPYENKELTLDFKDIHQSLQSAQFYTAARLAKLLAVRMYASFAYSPKPSPQDNLVFQTSKGLVTYQITDFDLYPPVWFNRIWALSNNISYRGNGYLPSQEHLGKLVLPIGVRNLIFAIVLVMTLILFDITRRIHRILAADKINEDNTDETGHSNTLLQ